MTGSLQIKGNKYYAVLNLKDCSGKRKPKWISTNISAVKGNKKKATAALNQIIAEYEDKVHAGKEAPLFTEYIARWLELEKSRIQQSTWESYECYCRKHIIPYFVPLGLTVDKVTSAHIKAYYDTKSVGGRGDNRKGGLSHSSLKNHSKVLKQVLDSAVIDEYISKNVATRVPIPKLATDTNESKAVFLNAAEANKLLSAFKEHRLQPLLYVTLYYGLRRSEILGLKWKDIDFENKTLEIKRAVAEAKNHDTGKMELIIDKPKSEFSERYIPIPQDVFELICKLPSTIVLGRNIHKKREGKELKTEFVFYNSQGKACSPRTWSRRHYDVFMTEMHEYYLSQEPPKDIPKLNLHELRHPYVKL